MNIHVQKFISGQEIKPGLSLIHHSNIAERPFIFRTVCDAVSPEQWHGEAWMGSVLLLKTNTHADHVAAGREAEQLLAQRLANLLNPESVHD